jgi:nucleotide-binding universal stress UspA family protein
MTTSSRHPIRSMLVHLDGADAGATRLAVARRLASRWDATLRALFVASPPDWPTQFTVSEGPAGFLETTDRAALQRARSQVDDTPADDGAAPTRWLDGSGTDAAQMFQRQALYADLLVFGQPDHAPHGSGAPAGFAASVLIHTGRPGLVVPSAGAPTRPLGGHVLIGWNGSRQSAHAVTAALPWLRGAKRVHVLDATDPSLDGGAGGMDLEQHLGLHGIASEVHRRIHADAEAGQVLLALAAEVGADLLVMGCYGHGRLRELVLGGATQTVLRDTPVPVLMAH